MDSNREPSNKRVDAFSGGIAEAMGDACLDQRVDGAVIESAAEEVRRSRQSSRVLSYKLALIVHDVVVGLCAAVIGVWLSGDGFLAGLNPVQKAFLIGLCLMPIAYFKTFRLYSYHLIFSKKYHLSNLSKAFCLSLVTFGAVGFIYAFSYLLTSGILILAVVGFAAAVLVINRYFSAGMMPLVKAFGLACIVVGAAEILKFREELINIGDFPEALVGFLAAAGALAIGRYALVHRVFNLALRRRFRRQVLLIGSDKDAEDIVNRIIDLNAPFWIAGTVSSAEDYRLSTAVPKTQLGRIRDLQDILGEHFFQEAIITDETIGKPELIQLLDFLTAKGITVWFLPKLMPIIDIKLYIDRLFGIPMIRLGTNHYQWLFRRIKHAFDAVAALMAFIVFLPVFISAALAVKLTSEGPVFYRPTAVGKRGRIFKMFKFRSMITGASAATHQDYVSRMIKGEIVQDGSGKTLKITNDPRVTKVGRILRKTSLDELPQLINVFKGDMSLVGPRPCLVYEYEIYKEWHKRRTRVRPGITGLWQVVGRSEVSFEDMILLDLYYIYNRSLELDFNILFETLFVLLKRKGAY